MTLMYTTNTGYYIDLHISSQVTFIGRLGVSREKAQVFIGSFFGHPQLGCNLSSIRLHSLEESLLTQYHTSREKLATSLLSYSNLSQKNSSLSAQGLLKHCEEEVSALYQQCFNTQVKLARLRNWQRHQLEASGNDGKHSVYNVDKQAHSLDVATLPASKLNKIIGCIIDTILVLNKKCNPSNNGVVKEDVSYHGDIPDDEGFEMNSELCLKQSPTLTEEECSVIFSSLCVHGVPKLHARTCALLIRLCGSQGWWGHFVTKSSVEFLNSSQTAVFNKER